MLCDHALDSCEGQGMKAESCCSALALSNCLQNVYRQLSSHHEFLFSNLTHLDAGFVNMRTTISSQEAYVTTQDVTPYTLLTIVSDKRSSVQ